MPTPVAVSVIIPTYNRKDSLCETLNSLAHQTYPSNQFEVIVVDDGSTDGTAAIATEAYPFILRYIWQSNQGDAAARNMGAKQSEADILVFLDDDILLEANYLTHIIQAHGEGHNKIVVGTCSLLLKQTTSFSQSVDNSPAPDDTRPVVDQPFTEVYSNNMCISRTAYENIGMMQGLDFPGSSMWCDLDFSYRAYRQGIQFSRSTKAMCWHRDYTVTNLDTYKERMRTAAFRAVVLFQRHPELLAYVPMFDDKTPITWGQDSPQRIARKMARAVASSRLALQSMEGVVHALEKRDPTSAVLTSLYRYIVGGYVFRGYREGLNEFGRIDPANALPGLWKGRVR